MPVTRTTRRCEADFRQYAPAYARDGVVVVKGALEESEMCLVETAFEHLINSPLTTLFRLNSEDEGSTVEAPGYSVDDPVVRKVMEHTAVTDIASQLFGGGPVWYVGEQLWMKSGGAA